MTVSEFLAGLPIARRKELARLRKVILENLPDGFEEIVQKQKMIVYQVPFKRYSDTYNGQPLWYAALAAQKNYLTLHLMPVYGSRQLATKLEDGFRAAGKKLDMGKACIRFQKTDDLALDVVGEVVASVPVDRWIEIAKAARRK
jgi:hypothetical protein